MINRIDCVKLSCNIVSQGYRQDVFNVEFKRLIKTIRQNTIWRSLILCKIRNKSIFYHFKMA